MLNYYPIAPCGDYIKMVNMWELWNGTFDFYQVMIFKCLKVVKEFGLFTNGECWPTLGLSFSF
jgi:hypothetical protein